jgi:hypothetical protein
MAGILFLSNASSVLYVLSKLRLTHNQERNLYLHLFLICSVLVANFFFFCFFIRVKTFLQTQKSLETVTQILERSYKQRLRSVCKMHLF